MSVPKIEEAAHLKVRADLMKGEMSRFSVDKLINMLTRTGMQVEDNVKPQAA